MTSTPPRNHPPPNVFLGVPGTRMPSIVAKIPKEDNVPYEPEPDEPLFVDPDKADIPLLIHHWGTSAATVWLEKRYHIWRGSVAQGFSLKALASVWLISYDCSYG